MILALLQWTLFLLLAHKQDDIEKNYWFSYDIIWRHFVRILKLHQVFMKQIDLMWSHLADSTTHLPIILHGGDKPDRWALLNTNSSFAPGNQQTSSHTHLSLCDRATALYSKWLQAAGNPQLTPLETLMGLELSEHSQSYREMLPRDGVLPLGHLPGCWGSTSPSPSPTRDINLQSELLTWTPTHNILDSKWWNN